MLPAWGGGGGGGGVRNGEGLQRSADGVASESS